MYNMPFSAWGWYQWAISIRNRKCLWQSFSISRISYNWLHRRWGMQLAGWR